MQCGRNSCAQCFRFQTMQVLQSSSGSSTKVRRLGGSVGSNSENFGRCHCGVIAGNRCCSQWRAPAKFSTTPAQQTGEYGTKNRRSICTTMTFCRGRSRYRGNVGQSLGGPQNAVVGVSRRIFYKSERLKSLCGDLLTPQAAGAHSDRRKRDCR